MSAWEKLASRVSLANTQGVKRLHKEAVLFNEEYAINGDRGVRVSDIIVGFEMPCKMWEDSKKLVFCQLNTGSSGKFE
jgi:hypothetical protein